ncbi:unnamed protein product [Symbiodinium natans]|uniref:Uncharacterized protein n=1 Tax=Symbiodinium natans TaxID=878477 RepID=A0A812JPT2_9DINO|nr:unnamed protein product [Symbiodinium natans]
MSGERLHFRRIAGSGPEVPFWFSFFRFHLTSPGQDESEEADGKEFQFLLHLIKEEIDRKAVMRFKFLEDQKRAFLILASVLIALRSRCAFIDVILTYSTIIDNHFVGKVLGIFLGTGNRCWLRNMTNFQDIEIKRTKGKPDTQLS